MRFKKGMNRLFLFCLGAIYLLGCGQSGGGLEIPFIQPGLESAIVVKGGKQGVTVIKNGNTIRYLGEVEYVDLGDQQQDPACFINVAFDTLGEDGKPVGQIQPFFINGQILKWFDRLETSCLRPGEKGSFETDDMILTGEQKDFQVGVCINPNDPRLETSGNCSTNSGAQVPLASLAIFHLDVDQEDGFRVFRNIQVENKADPAVLNVVAFDVIVHFTLKDNNGSVIDTVLSGTLRGITCDPSVDPKDPISCIMPGNRSEAFSIVRTTLPVEKSCGDCFDVRIYHSECVLDTLGGTCL
jgi:hypothetical protein